ncbi:C4-dicarboxylate transporter DctA [Ureibacillus sp. FSL K6-8385]|uniref:C4-dicarboxylate transporter DctA n=1 Tax=Ureibacillus terrenus TaxID=118246 RepID=A0A540V4U1_9BACL|nr:C4-dicarboxylate transporter DctA [Ureibacillus terrenus]MED3661551.1 C4-dicarboxylate transporter DctA [Ureibacillus terrenus]MED3764019.1 C4-dicarboxylate transporter DctA [Ureibacillus terrenus]TQE91764.1 C4-dicarboxylate transporter DctA [Ureibacillus terrenus]
MKILKNLTVQVIIAIILGIIVGAIWPEFGAKLKILADLFIKLIKMLIAPIIFLTVVIGIGSMGDVKKVGKIGGKALLYFEIVSTLALAIGIVVAMIIQPGKGLDTSAAENADISKYTSAAAESGHGFAEFISSIIPEHFVGALANGELLPTLFAAVLFGLAAAAVGERAKPVITFFENVSEIFFKIVGMVMIFSPIGAFGAMAYTIGNFGVKSLANLGLLMASVYTTMFLFIVLILGSIAKFYGINIFKFIAYIKEEIFIVIGTSSSESALPSLIRKLERFGCSKQTVGLVVPTGYSFNLDGTAIYLSMASLFIAQAYGIDLTMTQILTILAILMLTSKGAAGVTGSGFITLAATLAAFPIIPIEGIALLIGVDRFMSEARSVTNLIGNALSAVVISKSEKEFDVAKYEELKQQQVEIH